MFQQSALKKNNTGRLMGAVRIMAALLVVTLLTANPAFAIDEFILGTGNGVAGGTGVQVPLSATHDDAMQGFSVAITFDPLPIDATGLDWSGTAVETVSPGGVPEYVGLEIDNVAGTLTAGVVFGLAPVMPLNQLPQIPASPMTPNLLTNILFDIGANQLPGTLPVTLEPSLGQPPIGSVYSNDGFSFVPNLVSGAVEVTNMVRYYFDPMVVVPGGTLNAVVRCDHPDNDIAGLQLAMTYDSSRLSFVPPFTTEQYWAGTSLGIALDIVGETIEFVDVRTAAQNPVPGVGFLSIGAQFDFTSPLNGQFLAADDGDSIFRIDFNIANNIGLVGQTASIAFTDGIIPANPGGAVLPPATNVVITVDGLGIPPIFEDGLVEIVGGPSFIRGDANGDGSVNLADAIYVLGFLFSGGPAPVCFDSGDPNDDGNVDISDAVFLLDFLFTDGPAPLHPYPGCGLDSTPSSNPTYTPCTIMPSGCP